MALRLHDALAEGRLDLGELDDAELELRQMTI